MNEMAAVVVENVYKSYASPAGCLQVLSGASLRVERGAKIAIRGASGSGKSTLLHIIAGLSKVERGEVLVNGRSICGLRAKALTEVRRTELGFVFQRPNLLTGLTLIENVLLPLRINGIAGGAALARADEALDQVNLGARARHRVSELSEGEKQRGAIARAIVHKPAIVLADEPTGSLDPTNKRAVLDVFDSLKGSALILVTHDDQVAARCPAGYLLKDRVLTAYDAQTALDMLPGDG
jgi:ABC-type lipoprotein export system ATPase subunit